MDLELLIFLHMLPSSHKLCLRFKYRWKPGRVKCSKVLLISRLMNCWSWFKILLVTAAMMQKGYFSKISANPHECAAQGHINIRLRS